MIHWCRIVLDGRDQQTQDRACLSRAARRTVSSCRRSCRRAGGARPRCRHVLRQRGLVSARRRGARDDSRRPSARRRDRARSGAIPARPILPRSTRFGRWLARRQAGRRARPWVEGRRSRADDQARRLRPCTPSAPIRRMAAASITGQARRPSLLHGGRAAARPVDRRLSVRERLHREAVSTPKSARGRVFAASSSTACAPPILSRSRRTPTRPNSSMSASCAPSKASTPCSRRLARLGRRRPAASPRSGRLRP